MNGFNLSLDQPLPESGIGREAQLRREIVEVTRIAADQGLLRSSDGNVSVRLDAERLLVTPSGMYKLRLEPQNLLILWLVIPILKVFHEFGHAFAVKAAPLVPVLRSNFWLVIHVLTIVSSYAGGTLAWGVANIALLLLVFGNPRRETLKMLSQFTYRSMQIAVLLLAAGTFLGGWWAAYSWGRFWGWDPKETWALIALLGYLAVLHGRFVGWFKDFAMAVGSILGFLLVLMAWYGVNFVLGTGLHSYGFGSGGYAYVGGFVAFEIAVIVLALVRYRAAQAPRASSPAQAVPAAS